MTHELLFSLAGLFLALLPSTPATRLRPACSPILFYLAAARSPWLALPLMGLLGWEGVRQPRRSLTRWCSLRLALLLGLGIAYQGSLPLGVLLDLSLGFLLGARNWSWSLSLACGSLLLSLLAGQPLPLTLALLWLGLQYFQLRRVNASTFQTMVQNTELALEAAAELRSASQETRQRSELVRQFVAEDDYWNTLERTLRLSEQTLPARKLAIFVGDPQGQLVPIAQRTRRSEELEVGSEPIVEECWAHQRPVQRHHQLGTALAIPMEGQGVLFLAGPDHPVQEGHKEQLVLLASVAGQALCRNELQNQKTLALQQSREVAARLQSRLELADRLLQGVLSISQSLERENILRAALEAARSLAPGSVVSFEEAEIEANNHPSRLRVALESGGALVIEATHLSHDHPVIYRLLGASLSLALTNSELHGKLLQTSKMVAVGQLAAGVAHEINSPLMAIGIRTGLIKSLTENQDLRECADSIQAGVDRCRQISYALLSFVRSGSLQVQPIQLTEVVDQARGFLELSSPLQVELGADLWILGSLTELGQVVTNLLQNADQAMQEAHSSDPLIQVLAVRKGQEVILEVRDRGPGIAEDIKDRIFEPFFTTRQVGSGTGLGLFLAFNLIQAMGGHLEVESQPGQGSCFRCRLRYAPAPVKSP
ncbi:hypothetical protein JST97_23360 [bacterium]|nr:hypothetical protein [bacterium]